MDETLRAELLEMERVDRTVRANLVERGELHAGGYHPEMRTVHYRLVFDWDYALPQTVVIHWTGKEYEAVGL
jgi:hypothetical protein